jgi:hypothetical protein
MKHCNKCNSDKEESLFYKNRNICKACDVANNKAWRALNADKTRVVTSDWRSANADRVKLVSAAYRDANKVSISEHQAAYRKTNRDRLLKRVKELRLENIDTARAYSRAYSKTPKGVARRIRYREVNRDAYLFAMRNAQKANPEMFAANQAKRRATKHLATPNWADLDKIKIIYKIAATLRRNGNDVHVDHIVPLKNKRVCGLHVDWNLQIIPAVENISKHNRFELDSV